MIDSPDKIQWHPAFYAATGLELRDNIDELELISEYNLSKEPIRIDLLIIKNAKNIKNEIGHIMRRYNIIEYKSPNDGMSIDDFYKTVGYACLYKGYGEYVDQIPISELTVSLFRSSYPRELFASLEEEGYCIEERYPGIYYISNNLPFPAQIVVTSRLKKELHSSMRILSENVEREDIENFLREARLMNGQGERHNIDSILQVSVSANYELYQEVRRDVVMCQALQELMKDEIAEKVNDAELATQLTDIKNIMEKLQYTLDQAMDLLSIPQDKRALYISKM